MRQLQKTFDKTSERAFPLPHDTPVCQAIHCKPVMHFWKIEMHKRKAGNQCAASGWDLVGRDHQCSVACSKRSSGYVHCSTVLGHASECLRAWVAWTVQVPPLLNRACTDVNDNRMVTELRCNVALACWQTHNHSTTHDTTLFCPMERFASTKWVWLAQVPEPFRFELTTKPRCNVTLTCWHTHSHSATHITTFIYIILSQCVWLAQVPEPSRCGLKGIGRSGDVWYQISVAVCYKSTHE